MSETIDLRPFISANFNSATFENFVNFFLLSMVTARAEEGGDIQEVIDSAFGKGRTEKAEVKLEINGVELPFLHAMRRLYDQWGRIVNKEATRMVQEKYNDKTEPIFTLLDDLQRKLDEHLGVNRDEE